MKFNLLNIDGGKAETIDVSDKIMNLKKSVSSKLFR